MSSSLLQGRLFSAQLFPSPTEQEPCFSCKSRCLIDLNNVFIVAPEPEGDDVQPFQRALFRLEKPRQEVTFADSTCLSKDACKTLLEDRLSALTSCDIVGVDFPFFAQGEVASGHFKYRPCVALYGESGAPALYLAVYVGAFRAGSSSLRDFELYLKAPGDLHPPSAPDHLVDCSKICGFPNTYGSSESILYGEPTWKSFRVDPKGSKHGLSNRLSATNSAALRDAVVSKLIQLLVDNPMMIDYVDTTIEYDIGTWVEYRVKDDDGGWRRARVRYQGPPGYTHPLVEDSSTTATTPKSKPPPSPKISS